MLLELLERVLEMLPVWEGFQEILHLTANTQQDKMELVTVAMTISISQKSLWGNKQIKKAGFLNHIAFVV